MKISSIDVFCVRLPFYFKFKHSLATRAFSENLVVRVCLTDGTVGYGEGVPRDYVTGENIDVAAETIRQRYVPRFVGLDVSNCAYAINALEGNFEELRLGKIAQGAAWCALELAILDAVSRAHDLPLSTCVGPLKSSSIAYGAVVPFCGTKAFLALLLFYKLYGFSTVKVKVGRNLEEDVQRIKLARKILGPLVVLRVDANCAWSADDAIYAAERMRPFGVVSIEQPVPANDLSGLARVTGLVSEEIIVDESLLTIEQAQALAESRICTGFNIRLSKVGGILAAKKMVNIARDASINCHLGAQVGESGILSAAGRIFALIEAPFKNYEGSNNRFLLKEDLTQEDLTVGWKGYGSPTRGAGLGVTVNTERLMRLSRTCERAVHLANTVSSTQEGS
ncbi:MAG: hypothetical protein HY711_10335 [Candidatus Melainabacteria bacterium]|nr:hypothetical protein [Candidatus Melainabacteria bacterium]